MFLTCCGWKLAELHHASPETSRLWGLAIYVNAAPARRQSTRVPEPGKTSAREGEAVSYVSLEKKLAFEMDWVEKMN